MVARSKSAHEFSSHDKADDQQKAHRDNALDGDADRGASTSGVDWGAAKDGIEFLYGFDPNGWHNLCAFDPFSGRPLDARTFPPRTWKKMAKWLNDHLEREHNLYYSVNEPRPDARHSKLNKTEIATLRAVFVDVDPQGGADDLDSERARIEGVMFDLRDGPMPPSHVIDSGGGGQALWKIAKVDCNAANLTLAEGIGDCLSRRLGGDGVQNVDRILRLPGTDNIPNAKKLRKGRVRRRAELLYATEAVTTLEQLAEEFPAPPETERATNESTREWAKYRSEIDMDVVRAAEVELDPDLAVRFEAALVRSPKLKALWMHGEKDGDKSGSGYVLSLGFHLAHHGFSLNEFAQLAWLWKFTPGASGRAVNAGPRSLARVWARVEAERVRKQAEGDNPYLGLRFAELIAAAKALHAGSEAAATDADANDPDAQAKQAEVLAMRARLLSRQIIAAATVARLGPDEKDALLQALKQATKMGITVLRALWDSIDEARRQFERKRTLEAGGDPPVGGDWMAGLQTDAKGSIIANVDNTIIILRSPNFAGMLDYNELQAGAMLRRPVPEAGRPPSAQFRARLVNDIDLTTIQARLQRLWMPQVQLAAVEAVARDISYHPIRDWIDGLTWDGTARLDSWLADYLGAVTDQVQSMKYLAEIGPKFLISMVARIYRPGAQVDYMMVLEGGQGGSKSTACRKLAGAEFFSDALNDVTNKDSSLHLRGLWLIEIPELQAMHKAESTAMKSFLTRVTERYRPPYGRKETLEPRQCVFIGTTNETSYLKDATGNRRFWPVKVDRVDLAALERDREQLFAEAAVRFHSGEPWWPKPAVEAELIQPMQVSRRAQDIWFDPIRVWLDGLGSADLPYLIRKTAKDEGSEVGVGEPDPNCGAVRKEQTTPHEIAQYALGKETKNMSTSDWLRIVAVLTSLGWEKSHKSHGRMLYTRKACEETGG